MSTIIFRKCLTESQDGPIPELRDFPPLGLRFFMASNWKDVLAHSLSFVRTLGWIEGIRCSLKVLSGRRIFFGLSRKGKIIQSGWANLGFCYHYPVEADAVVLGPLWTHPAIRGKSLGSSSIVAAMRELTRRGYKTYYIDTQSHNEASLRMIAKAGFLGAEKKVRAPLSKLREA